MLFAGIYFLLIGLIGIFKINVLQEVLNWIALIAGVLILFGDRLIGYAKTRTL